MKLLRTVVGLLSVVGFSSGLLACPLHLKNDTDHTVLIVETDGDYAHILEPGQRKAFGNTVKHLNFYLFREDKNGAFDKECTIHQHTCTMEKKVETSVSIIEKRLLDTTFFDYEDEQSTELDQS